MDQFAGIGVKRVLARLRFLPIAGVAVVGFLLLRAQVCEWYLVPSPSMEPTLHGDKKSGDLVLVDKTAFWLRDPKPWDMVVVRGGKEGQIVKRLVCLAGPGGAAVAIRAGDVWVGPDERSLVRLAKDPVADRDLRVTHFEFDAVRAGARPEEMEMLRGARCDAKGLHLTPATAEPGELLRLLFDEVHARRRRAEPIDTWIPGHLATAHAVDLSFVDGHGAVWRESDHYDCDIGMELTAIPESGCRAIQLVFEHQEVYWSFTYGETGSVEFCRGGAALGVTGTAPPLRAETPLEIAFGHLDGRFFMTVGDRTIVLHEQEVPQAQFERIHPGPRFENLLHVGCAGGGLRIPRCRVFRDLWYRAAPLALVPIGEPTRLEAGEMYLLGDNTFDSLDSRMRSRAEGQFRREDLLGRPFAILAPRGRARWFTR